MASRRSTGEPHEAHTLTALNQETLEVPALEISTVGAEGEERRAPLGLTPVLIGKDDEVDIRLDDARVSRKHCSLTLSERGIVLKDLDSKNGTFVAGVQVLEALVVPGMEITLGGTRLVVRVAGSPAAVPLFGSPRFGDALGATVVMRALFAQLDRAAKTRETVLLLGESGT